MPRFDFDYSFLETDATPKTLGEKMASVLPGQYLWDIFPEEKIPNVFKLGYNHSIEGLAHKALTGKEFYDLGSYTPGIGADIASTIISFVATPTDFLTLGIGGKIGAKVGAKLMGRTATTMTKAGVPKATAQKWAQDGAEQVLATQTSRSLKKEIFGEKLAESVGSLGFYSGMQSALIQKADTDKISAARTLYDATKGGLTVYAGLLGAEKIGAPLAKSISGRLGYGGKFADVAARGGIEVSAFGTAPAFFETIEGKPRFPHPMEYVHAVGVIGGLRTGKTALGYATGAPEKSRLRKLEESEALGFDPVGREAKAKAKAEVKTKKEKERFEEEQRHNSEELVKIIDKDFDLKSGEDPIKFEVLESADPQTKADLANAKKVNLKVFKEMPKNEFVKKYNKSTEDPGQFQIGKPSESFKKMSPEQKNLAGADKTRKKLGVSDKEFQARKEKVMSNEKNVGVENARKLRREYEAQLEMKGYRKALEKDPNFRKEVALLEYGSVFKNVLGERLHKAFVNALAPAERTIGSTVKKVGYDRLDDFQVDFRLLNNFYLGPATGLLAKAGYYKIPKGKKGDAERDLLRRVLESDLDETRIKVGEEFKFSGKDVSPYKDLPRNKLLQLAHIIQRELGVSNAEAVSMKKKLFGKESLADATDAEIISYMNKLKPPKEAPKKGEETIEKFEYVDPGQVRLAFNLAISQAKASGMDVAPFEKNYVPRLYKLDVLDIFRGNLEKIMKRMQRSGFETEEFFSGTEHPTKLKKEMNSFLRAYIDEIGVSPEFKKAINTYAERLIRERKATKGENEFSMAFEKIREEVGGELFATNTNYFLSKPRTMKDFEGLESLLETNTDKIFARYFSQFAKSLSHQRHLGKDQAYLKGVNTSLHMLAQNPTSPITSKDISNFDQIVKMTTGAIEWNSKFNWNPKAKSLLQDITNFQVATKIGLGFAVIPNISQISISTALKTGYGPLIKGAYNYQTNKAYANFVNSVSYNYRDIFAAAFGTELKEAGFMGKFAQYTTERFLGIPVIGKWMSFNKINEINFKMSTVASYEYLLKQQAIAQGKGIMGKSQTHKRKAVEELQRAGIKDIKTDLGLETANSKTYKQLQAFAFKFSRDFQLQKNVLKDPKFANDPRWRPFFLFKRFGYRQAELFTRILKEEKHNPALYLRLAASGLFGTVLIIPAKELLGRLLAGEEIYNDDYTLRQIMPYIEDGEMKEAVSEYGLESIINGMAGVGALGVVSDILSAERKLHAVEFALGPVIYQDLDKMYKAVTRFHEDSGSYGINGAVKRTPKNLAPLLGTAPRRVSQKLWTDRQRESYIKYRKGLIRGEILDNLMIGNHQGANRSMEEWNRVYGYENPINFDEVDYDDIVERYIDKAEKAMSP